MTDTGRALAEASMRSKAGSRRARARNSAAIASTRGRSAATAAV